MATCGSLCFRTLCRRKPNMILILTASVLLAYFSVLSYMAYSQTPASDAGLLSSYVLSLDGKSLYEQDYLDPASSHATNGNRSCNERINFVFIKGMKCATSTLLGVFYRFGYTRNLSFVSPVGGQLYLNWPFPMTLRDFRPSSRGYNILTDHVIYTEEVMEAIMPKNTVYLGIIREPIAHVKSIFRYFEMAKIAGVPGNASNPFREYFSHLDKYESAYTAHGAKERWCIPDGFSMTKNLMSYCHGMPLGFPPGTKDISGDLSAIDSYIQYLDSKFNLIMIVEYFYESIILLRRLMCWQFKDIIFINSNMATYKYKDEPLPPDILDLIAMRSAADHRLYHYFNKTLWSRIALQTPDFSAEVAAFRKAEGQVQTYCQNVYQLGKGANATTLVVAETTWNREFSVTTADCWMLGPNPYELLHVVQKENDVREAKLLAERQKISDNRTLKGTC